MTDDDGLRCEVTSLGDDCTVLTLAGEWDVACRQRLHDTLLSLGTLRDVVVDLRQASFFDSSALGELISGYKRISEAGRRFETMVGSSNMRRLLEMTNLERLIGMAPDRQAEIERRLAAT